MQILFAITALCLLVLLWAGLAIRRHVRAAARERAERQRPSAKAMIEVELKHELHTEQAEKGFFGSLTDPQPGRHISRTHPSARESAVRAAVTAIPIFDPAALEAARAAKVPEPAPEPAKHTAEPIHEAPAGNESRKPPISISGAKFERLGFERLDMGQFNKDLGDLSDPYQVPRAAGRNRS